MLHTIVKAWISKLGYPIAKTIDLLHPHRFTHPFGIGAGLGDYDTGPFYSSLNKVPSILSTCNINTIQKFIYTSNRQKNRRNPYNMV